jgi:hypothetical protein
MDDQTRKALDQCANALQSALLLAERVRQNAGEQADDAARLEGAVDRAARAISQLKPEQGR